MTAIDQKKIDAIQEAIDDAQQVLDETSADAKSHAVRIVRMDAEQVVADGRDQIAHLYQSAGCTVEYSVAVAHKADRWVPGAGGTEQPYRNENGRLVLWVFNPATGKHAYLDCETDMILGTLYGA